MTSIDENFFKSPMVLKTFLEYYKHRAFNRTNSHGYMTSRTKFTSFFRKISSTTLGPKITTFTYLDFVTFFPNGPKSKNHYYNLVELIKMMLLHTRITFISHLDRNLELTKKFSTFFSYQFFLMSSFKGSVQKHSFMFCFQKIIFSKN